jgi:hypothetical protein
MQLFVTKKGTWNSWVLCLLALSLITACHNRASLNHASPLHVSMCELDANPAAYDGKLVTLTATITQLPNGKYLLPLAPPACSYSYIKVDPGRVQNSALAELESSSAASPSRKEFDLELTGVFDATYSEEWDAFRYRIIASEMKPQSPVRTGKPLGAA